jgi:glycosyltransferase involved in cell wall biosynthesis
VWTCWRALREEIRRRQPDIIHAQYGTITALVCAFAVRKPLVITYRGSDLNPSSGLSWIRAVTGKICSQIAALAARRIICVSSQLQERLWWRQKSVTVIPNGVETDIFHPQPQQPVRNKLGWGLDERIVLFNAGNGAKGKRQDLAEAGVEVARTLCGDIRLIVLSGNIDPKKIPDFMNGADCLIMASDWEGSPNIVKEALACNLPVVSVEVGDVREHLDYVTPSYIVSRDPTAIGRATAKMLTDRRRSNGYEYIERALSMPVVAQRILTVYGSL